jgi:hypothetical protein
VVVVVVVVVVGLGLGLLENAPAHLRGRSSVSYHQGATVSDSAKRYGIDPVWLGAMPAESRALFKEVLGRPDIMRGEMAGLYPSGGRSSTRTDPKCTQPASQPLSSHNLAVVGVLAEGALGGQ